MANIFSNFVHMIIGKSPTERDKLPIVDKKDELTNIFEDGSSSFNMLYQLNNFRMLSDDRDTQYNTYDDMGNDSIIAAALEIYADEATQYDEQGRIIWVESESPEITKAGNRLLDIFEIPERAWKHIYMACKYGDYYLKLYRMNEESLEGVDDNHSVENQRTTSMTKIVNDKLVYKNHEFLPPYEEYVEDVNDPATMFDLRKRGKCAGFVEVIRTDQDNVNYSGFQRSYNTNDVYVYPPDRFVHIMLPEVMNRKTEQITLNFGDDQSVTYDVARGKSVLYDVYPIQKELQLLEDALLLNRLTRSSLIRLLEIEVGDMPKAEVNPYLRRLKNLIEQHISMDKNSGSYQSYQSPGPIENVIYIPVRDGKGHISINNLGGDVNVKDIADIDYFNNKRAGALKVPRAYLGDDGQSSGLDNGGSLTKLNTRFAKTIKRIQTSYIRAITTLLNLFFIDKKLDYVNKFTVRMTSPSTQEDIERNELVNGNIDVVKNLMDLTNELEGNTQKEILEYMINNVVKMPDIANMIHKDLTPSDEFSVETSGGSHAPSFSGGPEDSGFDDFSSDLENELMNNSPNESGGEESNEEMPNEPSGEEEI